MTRASIRGIIVHAAEGAGRRVDEFVGDQVRNRSGGAIDLGYGSTAWGAGGRTRGVEVWRGDKGERQIVGKGR